MMRRLLALLVVVLASGLMGRFIINAQEDDAPPGDVIEADFDVDNQTPLVGQPFRLDLTIRTPPEVVIVEWPVFVEDWSPLMLVEIGEIITEEQADGAAVYRQRFDARLWRPGDFTTPETFVGYQVIGSDEIRRVPIRPVFFTVPSVLESTDLNTLELMPDKPPIWFFHIPAWAVVLFLGVIGGSGWLGWRAQQRRLARRRAVRVVKTPEQIALERLTALEAMPPAVMFTGAADVLRGYITVRLGVDAAEMTTHELTTALNGRLPDDRFNALQQILIQSDLVKFATAEPDEKTAQRMVMLVDRWIKAD